MSIRGEDFGTDLTLAEGDDGIWSPSQTALACALRDQRSLYERERARAEAAEARCEELRRAEVASRSRAGSLKSQFDACRNKLRAAEEETKEVRRTAKRQEGRIKFLEGEIDNLRCWLRGSHAHKERIEARHRDEIDWLKKDIGWLREALGQSADRHNSQIASLRKQLDRRRAAAARLVEARDRTIAWLHERNDRLRAATARATGMIASLREKNARLRAEVRALEAERTTLASRVETLEAQLAKLRAQARPAARRCRSWPHPAAGLEERTEKRNPAKDARLCSCCGKPYVANGERSTTVVEIKVRAHTRKIVRPRWRRSCDCASSPPEVTAPAGAAVRQHALRNQRVGVHPVRALCLLPSPPSGLGMAGGYGAGDLTRDAGRQREALRAAVRAGRQGDPRAPEQGGAASCRRNHLACAGVSRERAVEPGLAVDFGQR